VALDWVGPAGDSDFLGPGSARQRRQQRELCPHGRHIGGQMERRELWFSPAVLHLRETVQQLLVSSPPITGTVLQVFSVKNVLEHLSLLFSELIKNMVRNSDCEFYLRW